MVADAKNVELWKVWKNCGKIPQKSVDMLPYGISTLFFLMYKYTNILYRMPYFFILLYNVLRSMARRRAALLLLPPAALRAFSIR